MPPFKSTNRVCFCDLHVTYRRKPTGSSVIRKITPRKCRYSATKSRAGQFGGAEGFQEEITSERFRRYFKELYKFPPPSTYEQFVDYMAGRQEEWRQRLDCYNAIEIRYATFPFRMFLWIEDQEQAVFA